MLTGGFPRVTNSMMTNTFVRDIQRNLTSIEKLQRQISTGKKILNPSDDPVGADRALDYRQAIKQGEQYVRNIDDATSLASNVDGTLDQMESILMRIRDLAVRASNEGPEKQADIDAMAAEIDSLTDELAHQANRKFDNRFLFSGLKDNYVPFEVKQSVEFTYAGNNVAAGGATNISMPTYTIDGVTRTSQAITNANSVKAVMINGQDLVVDLGGAYAVDPVNDTVVITNAGTSGISKSDIIEIRFDKTVAVTYNGDMGTKEVEISQNSRVGTTYAGAVSANSQKNSLFGKYSGDERETASVEAFQKLLDLRDSINKYSTDKASNPNVIQDIMRGITDVDEIRSNITNIRAEQGGRVNRLELAKNRLESAKIYTKELLSNRENVDMAEAISEFSLMQNIYQSALGVGARIIQTTLLDFLR